MGKKTGGLIVLFLIVIIAFGVYLLLIIKNNPPQIMTPPTSEIKRDVPAGNAYFSAPVKKSDFAYTLIAFSLAYVKDYRSYNDENSGIPMLDLVLGFVDGSQEKNFTVTLVDN